MLKGEGAGCVWPAGGRARWPNLLATRTLLHTAKSWFLPLLVTGPKTSQVRFVLLQSANCVPGLVKLVFLRSQLGKSAIEQIPSFHFSSCCVL